MAITVTPLTLRIGAINPAFSDDPQAFADEIQAKAEIITQAQLSFFVSGSTAPTSDSGPWLKNGNTWYVWDIGTGAYIPLIAEQETLKYFIGSTTPDEDAYLVWFKTDIAGLPQGAFIWNGTSWQDINTYSFYTKTEIDAATVAILALFEPAVAGKAKILRANVLGHGDILKVTGGGTGATSLTVIGDGTIYLNTALNNAEIDTASGWDNSTKQYTVKTTGYYSVYTQAQFEHVSGGAARTGHYVTIYVNGVNKATGVINGAFIGGPVTVPTEDAFHLNVGDVVSVRITEDSDPSTDTFSVASNTNTILIVKPIF